MTRYVKVLLAMLFVWVTFSMGSVSVFAAEIDVISDLAASGLSVSKNNFLYITDSDTNQIYRYDGVDITLLAGNDNIIDGFSVGGYIDGIATYALFDSPYMAVSWNGGVIVSDTNNNVLRFIADDLVETYAGTGESGHVDGIASSSTFNVPTGLAVDDAGNLYVADTGNGVIRMVTSDGIVTTYADGMHGPTGLFWYEDVLYVTDTESNEILQVVNGEVTVIAGLGLQDDEEWVGGYQDGTVEEATFSLPEGIYVDDTGIYIGDVGNDTIRKIVDGVVCTIYEGDSLAEPVSITKYKDNLLVGDPLLGAIQIVEEVAVLVTNEAGSSSALDTEVDESEMGDANEGEVTIQVESGTSSNTWILIGILSVLLFGVIIAIAIVMKKCLADGDKIQR